MMYNIGPLNEACIELIYDVHHGFPEGFLYRTGIYDGYHGSLKEVCIELKYI